MNEDRPAYSQPTVLPDATVRRNRGPIIAIGLLGAGVVVLGGLAAYALYDASTARATVNDQVASAVKTARAAQQTADANAARAAAESPYRSYVAPLEYGSFEVKFPKSWSSEVTENRSGSTQVDLNLNPDIVRTQNNALDKQATRVMLIQRTLAETSRQYDTVKTLKKADFTISGIKGVEYTGTFTDKRTARMIVIPVRDKSLIFTNENTDYAEQFSQILQQTLINP